MSGIFHRTSIRKYLEKPVEQEKIEKILRAAMASPSAANQQPWEFYVVTNKEKIKALTHSSKYCNPCETAQVVFVSCYKTDSHSPDYREIDLSAATENMLLEIDELGLGGCWMGIAPNVERMKYVREVVGIPANLRAFALVSCGYPAEEKKQQDRYDEKRVHYVK